MILWAEDAQRLADFMEFALGNIAREACRLHGWSGKFWETRYRPIAISSEEGAQIARLRYLLSQGCKENLVTSPKDWPGLHAATMLLSTRPLEGVWVDRTALYRRRRTQKGRNTPNSEFEHPETLELAKLPCWKHLSDEEYRARIQTLIEEIELETRQRHRREGTRALGRKKILKQHPHRRGNPPPKRRAPRIHAHSAAVRQAYLNALSWFLRCYRRASERLRAGEEGVRFPEGSFPPGLPFVRPGLPP